MTFVSETLGFAVRSMGSLAGTWFEVVLVETKRKGARMAREVRIVRTNIVDGGGRAIADGSGGEVGDVNVELPRRG